MSLTDKPTLRSASEAEIVRYIGRSDSLKDAYPSPSAADRVPVIGAALGALNAWEGATCQEPNVWFANDFYHMLYTAGASATSAIGYAYASNPFGPWTKPLTTPVIGNGNGGVTAGSYCAHTGVYIEGSTIYLVTSLTPYTGQALLFKAPLNFNVASGPVFTQVGAIMTLPSGYNGWGNFAIVKQGDSAYALLAEVRETATTNYKLGVAFASGSLDSGPTFANGTFPLSQLISQITYWGAGAPATETGGPFVAFEGSTCVLYFHAGPKATTPTDVFRATSNVSDLINWTVTNNGFPVMRREHLLEVDQTADPSIVIGPGGDMTIFTTAYDNLSASANVMATPMFQATFTTSNAYRQHISRTTDNFNQRSFSAPLYLSTSVSSYTALNKDDICFNNGVNSLTITAPRANWGSYFRVSNFNPGARSVTVNFNASDKVGYSSSGGGSVVVNQGEMVTFVAISQGWWVLSRPPIGTPTTGAQTATFAATNKPGSATGAPTLWLPYVYQGTTYYIPLFAA